ncbi:MAG TPA: UDP-N-acetylmuramate--L-alanine ligase [Acidobacteriota bacterium]|nr:UDP-N-acetylmuramate--L-alanine ligase [Acidobacteriota bacterium]
MFGKIKRIHMVGIGGSGMCGIAEILLDLGHSVSGSDLKESAVTARLASLGALIQIGHAAENVGNSDVVVISSAVSADNPEVITARARKIPVIPRAEMLAELMRIKYGITIAGAHGKTTTTSMTGLVLHDAGLDPTIIIGGRLQAFGSNARAGRGEFIVVEADESDGSFLKLSASIAVITNIDSEHLDHYKDLDEIRRSFIEFANKVPFYGAVILCIDNAENRNIMPFIQRKAITYGLSHEADFRAVPIQMKEFSSEYEVYHHNMRLGVVKLHVPGMHSIVNSLAAIAAASELEISFDTARTSLAHFRGVDRRFQLRAEANDILIVDDYAHHPSEIEATLNAARQGWNRRIVAVFQPHRYTRLYHLFNDFTRCFNQADVLVLTDIYAAGEEPIPDVTIDRFVKTLHHPNSILHKDINTLPEKVLSIVRPGDLVLFLGAGNITSAAEKAGKLLLEKHNALAGEDAGSTR